jgi:hypothetical protein
MPVKPTLPADTKDRHYYLVPVYHHYKQVKVIDRCCECDHKTGSHLEERGVKIIGWEVKWEKKDLFYFNDEFVKQMNEQLFFKPNMSATILNIKRI